MREKLSFVGGRLRAILQLQYFRLAQSVMPFTVPAASMRQKPVKSITDRTWQPLCANLLMLYAFC